MTLASKEVHGFYWVLPMATSTMREAKTRRERDRDRDRERERERERIQSKFRPDLATSRQRMFLTVSCEASHAFPKGLLVVVLFRGS